MIIQMDFILKNLSKGNQTTSHYLKVTAWICYNIFLLLLSGFFITLLHNIFNWKENCLNHWNSTAYLLKEDIYLIVYLFLH